MIIEQMINQLLQMDSELIKIMQPLAHKIIRVHCTNFPKINIYILFDIDHISLLINRNDLTADTNIESDLTSFIKFLQNNSAPLSTLGIKVYGDLATAQDLEIFIKKLDLDWEEHLAKLTNDQFSAITAKSLKASFSVIRQQANSLTMMLSDYLLYEKNLIPTREMLNEFYQHVDDLREAVDRLSARLDYYANT